MLIPILKDDPELDELMNIEDAKELFEASSDIQKFIEYASQDFSRKISSKLYDIIKTSTSKSHEFELHISAIESYAVDYKEWYNCELRITENILEKIARRIAELFRENAFCVGGRITSNDHKRARIEIKGWSEEFDREDEE